MGLLAFSSALRRSRKARNNQRMTLALSVLDLAPVPTGTSAAEALRRTVDLARLADRLGFHRYWFAEHHSMASVASSAPDILIAHVAAATQRIRVGSGGMMLPNHAPLRIVEIFKTLEALHPGRIDLGIGRAPGSEPAATRALRAAGPEHFSALMSELLQFAAGGFQGGHPFHRVRPMPSETTMPPIWILGSTGASARAAGAVGMGYSFASHFSAEPPRDAFEAYRDAFKPSGVFAKPHAILGVEVVCADSAEEADRLATTMDLAWLRINRSEFLPLPSPEEVEAYPWSEIERVQAQQRRALMVVGDPGQVRDALLQRAATSGADEIMVVSNVHDHGKRLRCYELLAEVLPQLG